MFQDDHAAELTYTMPNNFAIISSKSCKAFILLFSFLTVIINKISGTGLCVWLMLKNGLQ